MRGGSVLLLMFAAVTTWAQSANPWATIPRPPRTQSPPQPARYSQISAFDATAEQQFLELTNQARVTAGLAPLQLDDSLTRAARKHSALMVAQNHLSHDLPGEPSLPQRLSPTSHFSSEGENVGYAPSVADCHRGLMNSPHHRENILDKDFTLVGFGVMRSGNEVWVTEDFADDRPPSVRTH